MQHPTPSRRSRRLFLQGSLGASGMLLLAACQTAAPAAPTSAPTAPAKPTEAPSAAAKPAAPASAAPAPSPSAVASPVAAPKPAASPAAAASPSPAVSVAGLPIERVQPLAQRARVRTSVSGVQIAWLPLFVAVDKGYFQRAGIDLDVAPLQGSSNALVPLLARGDLDIAPATPSPAHYNQVSEGFDVRIVASNGIERPGRLASGWISVLKEKAGEIKELKDLKGRTIEAAVQGVPSELLILVALQEAGLDPDKDATLTYRARSIPDIVALAQQKAADAFGISEPLATQAEQQGIMNRWKSFADVMPWYQPAFWGASGQFAQQNKAVLAKFLEVHLATVRELNATNGVWAPEYARIMARWSGIDAATIPQQGQLPYYDPNDAISTESLTRVQDVWVQRSLIKTKVDIPKLVDTSALDDALGRLGRA